jgi:tetratricopeptide (TPR) repeat protein
VSGDPVSEPSDAGEPASDPTHVGEELSLPAALSERLDGLGLTFLADFLEIDLQRHPDNVEALAELGHVYTRQGRLREGLAVDRRLVGLVPENPTVHYNLACSQSLLGDVDGALASLATAVRLGYDDGDYLAQDEDLERLRAEPRFQALVSQLGGARPSA